MRGPEVGSASTTVKLKKRKEREMIDSRLTRRKRMPKSNLQRRKPKKKNVKPRKESTKKIARRRKRREEEDSLSACLKSYSAVSKRPSIGWSKV